jgi:hypothetical protein
MFVRFVANKSLIPRLIHPEYPANLGDPGVKKPLNGLMRTKPRVNVVLTPWIIQ